MSATNNLPLRFGIDLGGTKIEIAALDTHGNIIYQQRIKTPQGRYQDTLQCIVQLVAQAEASLDSQGSVGICTPGAISPASGLLRNSNSTCLNHTPFLTDLQHAMQRDIRMANDANCFALSEATDGNAQHSDIVFGVIVGTGCGGGVVINKQLIDGANAICGEWGHNPLPYASSEENSADPCWCGNTACIETFLSASGLCNDYWQATGEQLTSDEIVRLSQQQQAALLCMQRYEDRMARSLAQVINILDPHTIVLGGGMSNIQQLYDNVPLHWQKYIFSDSVRTQLVPPKHGDSSGVRGAAWLWNS